MKLLKKLYYCDAKSHSDQMINFAVFVTQLCKQRGATVTMDKNGNVYVVKGKAKSYPCICAHLDEVHAPRGKNFRVVVEDGNIIKGYDDFDKKIRHGIGADDKNGIWVALRCLETTKAIKLAFFVDEEVGCLGSAKADMSFFSDCRFVLQIDRRNNCDFITDIGGTELCDAEFLNDVYPERWGYKVTDGLSTDVCELKENGLSVACCNLSCGYYNPHTANEFTDFNDLKKCLRLVKHIIKDCKRVYHHEYKPRYGRYGTFGSYGGWYDYDDCYYGTTKVTNTKKEDSKVEVSDDKKDEFTKDWEYDMVFEAISEIKGEWPTATKDDVLSEIEYRFGGVDPLVFDMAFNDAFSLGSQDENYDSIIDELIELGCDTYDDIKKHFQENYTEFEECKIIESLGRVIKKRAKAKSEYSVF